MIDQAIIQKEIETLPSQYYEEIIEFIGYLRHKAQKTEIHVSSSEHIRIREIECINRYANELNMEMEDILLDFRLEFRMSGTPP